MADMDTDKWSTPALAGYLYMHILTKGFQAGGVLAIPISVGYALLKAKKLSPEIITRVAGLVCGATVGLSAAAGAAKFTQINRDGFADRSYRLYHNHSQHRTDKFGNVGAAVGLAATAYMKSRGLPLQSIHLAGGAALGTAVGVAAHLLTRTDADQKVPNQVVNIIKHEVAGAK